jgi:hypothetical protein
MEKARFDECIRRLDGEDATVASNGVALTGVDGGPCELGIPH